MDDDLQIIKRDGWVWRLKYPEALTPWFADYRTCMLNNPVKSNDLRVTFKVGTPIGCCYVKYDRPKRGLKALRSRFVCKAKSEFGSARLLTESGVNVIEYLGWGHKGNEGMIVSRELRGALNARDHWFSTASLTVEDKENFLDKLAIFLRKVFSGGLYHPDLHLGNLVLEPDRFRFALVDPYGVRRMNVPTLPMLFRMWRIIGALRGEITDGEAAGMVLKSKVTSDPEEAKRIWMDILVSEAREMEKLWPKRRRQILSGKSKYAWIVKRGGVEYAARMTMSGASFVKSAELDDLEDRFDAVKIKSAAAKRAWLNSFKLQFNRIPHRRPVVWRRGEDETLFYERLDPKTLGVPTKAEREAFAKRCEIVGIQPDRSDLIKDESMNRIVLVGGDFGQEPQGRS